MCGRAEIEAKTDCFWQQLFIFVTKNDLIKHLEVLGLRSKLYVTVV